MNESHSVWLNPSCKLSCYKPLVNHIDITSFNSWVIAFLAVTVLWRFVAMWTETFLYALPRNWRDSLCNALLIQSYSLLWKRIPTIHRPAMVPSMLPQQCVRRNPAQQMGRLQLSGVISHYESFFWLSVKWRNSHIKTMHSLVVTSAKPDLTFAANCDWCVGFWITHYHE
jgi:hypothetical protein